ncbi:flagellar biosynthesis protein FlgJ [Paracoccus seriniphilus]|uniref:flagellar biosynthesis protein FlgJ n=1 Tax=Paracoccus seriniphilus TaxID=184748 RepID=UPI00356ABAD9
MQVDQIFTNINPVNPTKPEDGLEAMFLEEMLKYCGVSTSGDGFCGGPGEEQFSSFLTREYAGLMAQKLDLGFGSLLSKGGKHG